MKIDAYSFGRMVINGKDYTSDLIIYPDRIDDSWWRKLGHLLQMDDLAEILAAKPAVLILGTGYMGVMKVPGELEKELSTLGIEVYVRRSKKAVDVFNAMGDTKGVIAAFHLTC